MSDEPLENICFHCNYFFPSRNEMTEYGICLRDEAFDPYVEELLDNQNYACCQELIDEKEFVGDQEGCERFEAVTIINLDEDDLMDLLNTDE